MSVKDLTAVLSSPAIFGLFKNMVGGPSFAKRFVETYVRVGAHQKIMDIGCGTGDILGYLPPVDYWGFDMSAEYIGHAAKKFSGRGQFFCRDVFDGGLAQDGSFDVVMAIAILHHLSDEQALKLFQTAWKALKPGGRFVTLDGCFADGQSWAARRLLSMDRGKHVRTAQGYRDLASTVFKDVKATVLNGQLRIPYTHLVMEITKR